MKINHDAVDGRFKLRYPSKIAVDMSTGLLNKKIKLDYLRSIIRILDPKFERTIPKIEYVI